MLLYILVSARAAIYLTLHVLLLVAITCGFFVLLSFHLSESSTKVVFLFSVVRLGA